MPRITKAVAVIGAVLAVAAAGVVVARLLSDTAPAPETPADLSTPTERRPAKPDVEGLSTRPGASDPTVQTPIRPRAFDPADEPEPGRDEARIAITVVGLDDRPISGAILAIVDPEASALPFAPTSSRTATTGADGTARVRFDVALGSAHVLVMAPSHAPLLVRVEDRNRQRIKLPGEAWLRGRVVVDGKPSKVRLRLDVVDFIDPAREWSQPIRNLLIRHGFNRTIPFDTDQAGDFAVFGLTKGEAASIRIPIGTVFARMAPDLNKRTRSFDCDGAPILLELAEVSVLSGRIVTSRTATPSDDDPPNLDVRYFMQPVAEGSTGSVKTKPDGAFRIPFLQPVISVVSFEIWDAAFGGRIIGQKKFEQPITGSKDLGDIVLDDSVAVSFLLTNSAGEPVEKGRVMAAGAVSPETGADGRTILALNPATRGIVVGAPNYRIEGVRLPESLPATMEVRLKAASQIIVRVRHEDSNETLRGIRVALAYAMDEVVAAAEGSPAFGEVRITKPSGSSGVLGGPSGHQGIYGRAAGGSQTHYYDLQPGKDVVVSGFKAGDQVEVRVEDRHGYILLTEKVSLAEDEVKAMEMIVRSKPKTLRGTILDEARRSIPTARVRVQSPSPAFRNETACDAAGGFEIPDVYGVDPSILIRAPDFVAKSVGPPEVLQNPTIILEAGRKLAVRLTGGNATDVLGNVTLTIQDGDTITGLKQADDLWVFEDAPKKAGTIRVQGRKSFSTASVGPNDLRVDVPRPE